jgi:DNA-binding FadR family transcriptional regulator
MTSLHDSLAEMPVRQEGSTAAATVADDLVRRIVAGLPPGSSLASEAELAAGYGVSRVTVREAIKMLAGRGLLDLGRGRRAVVREPDGAALGEFMSWVVQYDPKGVFDLVEVRLSLEVQSAGLAARRATRPALAAIEATMAAMRAAAGPLDAGDPAAETAFHKADVGFHEAVAMAGGNRILTCLFEAMALPLRQSFFMSRRGRELRGQTSAHTLAAHAAIIERVRARDPLGAEEAMRAHLADSGRDLRAAFAALPARADEA